MEVDLNFIWKSVVIVFGGALILRLAGRKSISQLTVAQTVLMIAVGSLIIQPVSDRNIWITMIITFLLVLILILIEYAAMRFDILESFFYGKSVLVIEKGQIIESNLKKLRLTVDMLELRLRQQGIQQYSDVELATIESNGQLGYLLKQNKQVATKEDIERLMVLIQSSLNNTGIHKDQVNAIQEATPNLFDEVKEGTHKVVPPSNLK